MKIQFGVRRILSFEGLDKPHDNTIHFFELFVRCTEMSFQQYEDELVPWFNELPKEVKESYEGLIFHATAVVLCRKGYLVETEEFKTFLFENSAAYQALFQWELKVADGKESPTPGILVKKTAKNGYVFGIDADNLCKVKLSGGVTHITPTPPPTKGGKKQRAEDVQD